jgi:hypothetical protein
MILLILILVFYILPFYKCYTWFHKAHSKDGRWEDLKPDMGAFIFTIIPVLNIIAAVSQIGDSPLKEKKEKTWLNKFFRIKK